MDGLLLVDKPRGWSTYDVIRKLKAVLRPVVGEELERLPKLGHAGTLDPLAEGLVLVLVGKACKQAQHYTKLDKRYEAEITLGFESDTDDAEGPLSKIATHEPSVQTVQAAVNKFQGEITQTPPQFSALKVGGQRAYRQARQGKKVALATRKVTVYEIGLKQYRYPQLNLETKVSSGTYIRALARDIGQELGTGAYLSRLVRTEVGPFKLKAATGADDLDLKSLKHRLQPLT